MITSIRNAEKKDVKQVHQFINELESMSFPFEKFESFFYQNLLTPYFIYMVAENEHAEIVGYISCHGQVLLHHCSLVFEIQELFVAKDYRGKGIGKKLVDKLEEVLQAYRYNSLEVTANQVRTGTHRFYQECGFTKTHVKFTRENAMLQ